MGRLGRKNRREPEDTELNMVPIMNMFMVLIPFLLMSAAFYHIRAVNTSIPVHGNRSLESVAAPSPVEVKVTVVVELKADRITVSALSDQLDSVDLAKLESTLHRPLGGGLAVPGLAECLESIKTRYPASDTLLLIPDGDVSYDEIIKAMDCARNTQAHELFPNVVLTGSLG